MPVAFAECTGEVRFAVLVDPSENSTPFTSVPSRSGARSLASGYEVAT